MTRSANARIAGFTFLFYIAVALPTMMLMNRATDAEGAAAQLARVAEHVSDVRIAILLTLFSCFAAIVLAVTLYGITRDEDHELAMLVLACRLAEGIVGAIGIPNMQGLLWLATRSAGVPDQAAASVISAYMLMPAQNTMIGAPFFALGSLIFSYLLLRGRIVPVPLAWLGVLASALLVVCLPLQFAGFLRGPITSLMYLPMLAFEVPLGIWLFVKGVAGTRPTDRRWST
jgi:Domain of unknown function (DUF4386)